MHCGRQKCWPSNDDCEDFWEILAEKVSQSPPQTHEARWVPGHLDDPKKKEVKELTALLTEMALEEIDGPIKRTSVETLITI